MVGLIGIILSLALLMYLAYRGITVLVLAPFLACLAVVFAGDLPLLATYTQVFMNAAGRFVITYFPLFLLGALFGKLMDDSGSARTIAHWIVEKLGAERSILAVVLACAILTYGGVSLFVVAFAVYPIAVALFREAQIPKRLVPGAIALGSFTFTMTALPGTPAIQNLIPMPYFGTDAFAAPGLGILAGAIMLGGGTAWLNWRHHRARTAGEGYGVHHGDPQSVTRRPRSAGAMAVEQEEVAAPGIAIAILPIILVIVLNFVFTNYIIPTWETGYLAEPQYGSTTVDKVKGSWSIIIALVLSSVVVVALNWSIMRERVVTSVNEGSLGSLLPIFNTASEVGYGAVIASLAAFTIVRDFVINLSPDNPLISLAVAVNVLAGITGSASGGMSIALETLGRTYAEMGQAAGMNPEILHRVTSISSGGFDALPHNGAVITLLAICKLTHRQSYADIGMVAVVIPVTALIVIIVLATMFGSF
ncbi:citrate transporter [Skermanella aerolata]|uniref:Citrate transporter n=1 Tax=Skermanella aerolata TaxID=393310 RepID=A0A512DZ16_9PROT|nr:GntP family permease [Skermanella aerolata]KJB92102.1 citrate transporter [Skermanella aerolata KACC 11604]GEO41724.1 citrate transporter [Skermanella aerolata]